MCVKVFHKCKIKQTCIKQKLFITRVFLTLSQSETQSSWGTQKPNISYFSFLHLTDVTYIIYTRDRILRWSHYKIYVYRPLYVLHMCTSVKSGKPSWLDLHKSSNCFDSLPLIYECSSYSLESCYKVSHSTW